MACQEVAGGVNKINVFNVEFPNVNSLRREVHVAHFYGNTGGAFNEVHFEVGGVYEANIINEEHSNVIPCRS